SARDSGGRLRLRAQLGQRRALSIYRQLTTHRIGEQKLVIGSVRAHEREAIRRQIFGVQLEGRADAGADAELVLATLIAAARETVKESAESVKKESAGRQIASFSGLPFLHRTGLRSLRRALLGNHLQVAVDEQTRSTKQRDGGAAEDSLGQAGHATG